MPGSPKYFIEADSGHYDVRFFKGDVDPSVIQEILLLLLRDFVSMCAGHGVRPILMHGGLIGWHWSGRLLPWDSDLDLCVLLAELERLNAVPSTSLAYDRRYYHFDINPNFTCRSSRNSHHSQNEEMNRIDARFIHCPTGLFIDITALAEIAETFRTKCPHVYNREDLFPLQAAKIEHVDVHVPARVVQVLEGEYGRRSTTQPFFGPWEFSGLERQWVLRSSLLMAE
jgi:hypothetical protein